MEPITDRHEWWHVCYATFPKTYLPRNCRVLLNKKIGLIQNFWIFNNLSCFLYNAFPLKKLWNWYCKEIPCCHLLLLLGFQPKQLQIFSLLWRQGFTFAWCFIVKPGPCDCVIKKVDFVFQRVLQPQPQPLSRYMLLQERGQELVIFRFDALVQVDEMH